MSHRGVYLCRVPGGQEGAGCRVSVVFTKIGRCRRPNEEQEAVNGTPGVEKGEEGPKSESTLLRHSDPRSGSDPTPTPPV